MERNSSVIDRSIEDRARIVVEGLRVSFIEDGERPARIQVRAEKEEAMNPRQQDQPDEDGEIVRPEAAIRTTPHSFRHHSSLKGRAPVP